DAHESFAMPVILGTLAGNMRSGTITGTIPASTPYGKGYRIRIISSDLPLAGPGISDSISILRPPQAPILSFAGGYLISDVANVLWYGPAGRIYGAQS